MATLQDWIIDAGCRILMVFATSVGVSLISMLQRVTQLKQKRDQKDQKKEKKNW